MWEGGEVRSHDGRQGRHRVRGRGKLLLKGPSPGARKGGRGKRKGQCRGGFSR